ncbi:MAG: LacI family transcriptional regulator [Spirochaetaceae bacterium]|nr:MAG: LacI family transcriptional regulator [Spirochaetaceae bacterium]
MASLGKATIYDVASAADVSAATVSRYLNTPDKVKPETRERIRAAMEELQFTPDAYARERARKGFARIGVVTPHFPAPSFVQRVKGVAKALEGSPHELIIYTVDTPENLEHYISVLPATGRVDGLILMSLHLSDRQIESLHRRSLEVVCVEFENRGFPAVTVDTVEGGRLAARHLVATSDGPFAYIGETPPAGVSDWPFLRRMAGYRSELEVQGFALADEHVSTGAYSMEEGYRMTAELLQNSTAPRSLFAGSDLHAIGALKAAAAAGVAVPEQLAIVGFDDIDVASYMEITTIHQSLEESGRVAVELLLAGLAEPGRPIRSIQLPVALIERNTTRPRR